MPTAAAVAIDGKTLRGADPPDGHSRPLYLLAAMEHTSRVVLAAGGMLADAVGNPACQALVTAALWRRDAPPVFRARHG